MAYVVVARWRAKEGKEDELARVIAELLPLSRAEPGSLFYQANRSLEDPRLFLFYEQYADEDAYKAHGASDHFTRLAHEYAIPELLESRERDFFETYLDDRGGLAG
jgi:quinol monooxygenase YgiN